MDSWHRGRQRAERERGAEGGPGGEGKERPRGLRGKWEILPYGKGGRAEQESTEVFVGKVKALLLTRSWTLRNGSYRWKTCVLCPGVRLQVT